MDALIDEINALHEDWCFELSQREKKIRFNLPFATDEFISELACLNNISLDDFFYEEQG